MSQHDRYISPFSTRYASDEMQYIFSDDNKFRTWRRLWVALARAEMKQGLTNITPEMVAELEAHVDDINYEVAIEREKLVRHDVMSHVYAYGQQCPKAAGIIHLGATSCYVGDNTDIIVMRQGLELVRKKLVGVLAKLAHFAKEYKDMPCMAYTHCQPAQPTTVGKRATLWANELVMDLAEIDHRLATLQLRGVKGTTGTQASFMELFKGDANKIRAVDASIAKEMGFDTEKYDGETMIRLRANGGDISALKKQAMEELSAIGVTFPVKATYFIIASSTSALDNATILKQCFSDSFGDDFIKLDVQTYVSSLTQEVRTPQLQSFVINGWSADFGDPVNFLGQETLHDDNAFYSHYYSNIARVAEAPADYQKDLMDAFEQYTDLVNAANAIVNDTDARYEAFAKAEAYMLENVLVSPTYYDIAWSLTHANEYSKINAMYGGCNYKAVNWETSEEAYTTVQYEQFAKAFDAAKS